MVNCSFILSCVNNIQQEIQGFAFRVMIKVEETNVSQATTTLFDECFSKEPSFTRVTGGGGNPTTLGQNYLRLFSGSNKMYDRTNCILKLHGCKVRGLMVVGKNNLKAKSDASGTQLFPQPPFLMVLENTWE